MVPKCSLQSSQEPATGPCSAPDNSGPHPHPTLCPVILSATPTSLPFKPSNQHFARICHQHACYMPRPLHPPWYYHPNNILKIEIMKLLTSRFSSANFTSSLLSTLFSKTLIWFSEQTSIISQSITVNGYLCFLWGRDCNFICYLAKPVR